MTVLIAFIVSLYVAGYAMLLSVIHKQKHRIYELSI